MRRMPGIRGVLSEYLLKAKWTPGVGDWAGAGSDGGGHLRAGFKGLALTLKPSHCPQTPLTNSEESLDFSVSLEQVQATRGGAGRGQHSQGFRA